MGDAEPATRGLSQDRGPSRRALLGGARSWVAACALWACTPSSVQPEALAPAHEWDDTPEAPLAQGRATTGSGRVVLADFQSRRAVEEVVKSFMDAISSESVSGLEAVVADDAQLARSSAGGAEPLTRVWEARFRRFEFSRDLVHPLAGTHYQVLAAEDAEVLAEAEPLRLPPKEAQWVAVLHFGFRSREAGLGPRMELLIAGSPGGYRIVRAFEYQQNQ